MNINLNISLNIDNRIIKISKKLFSKRGAFAFLTFLLIMSTIILQGSQIAKPYDFIADTVINPDEVNANFDELYAESNAQNTRIFDLESKSKVYQYTSTCYEPETYCKANCKVGIAVGCTVWRQGGGAATSMFDYMGGDCTGWVDPSGIPVTVKVRCVELAILIKE